MWINKLIFSIKYAKLVDGKGKGSTVSFLFLNVRRRDERKCFYISL